MDKQLKLVTNTFISVNHYMGYKIIKQKGKNDNYYNTIMPYKPKETTKFEKEFGLYVKEEVIKQNWIKPSKNTFVIMDTIFYFPRVDMDAQNYFKSLCDIMTKNGVWEDDNIVMEHVKRIYYDSKNPRIEICISESPIIGIFNNKEELQSFLFICKSCKRYENNCSILKNAKDSRIQNEIFFNKNTNKWICNKDTKLK